MPYFPLPPLLCNVVFVPTSKTGNAASVWAPYEHIAPHKVLRAKFTLQAQAAKSVAKARWNQKEIYSHKTISNTTYNLQKSTATLLLWGPRGAIANWKSGWRLCSQFHLSMKGEWEDWRKKSWSESTRDKVSEEVTSMQAVICSN